MAAHKQTGRTQRNNLQAMSQLVLDDQLDLQVICPPLERWMSIVRLQDLRPGEHILNDRVPQLLLARNKPTFVTIDHGFPLSLRNVIC